ncbi:MAG: tetratricopeptide repeat protein [Steroidobacteraceae bacterium]
MDPENEDKQPKADAQGALADAEAFAEGVAAKLADNPEVAQKIVQFLSEQTHLLKVKQQHLQNEHELRLLLLRGQTHESKLRRTGIWIRMVMLLFLAVMAAFIVAGILMMIGGAATSRNIVIDPFESPPALAANGLNGKVLASSLRDQLWRIQAVNRSAAERLALSNPWTHDIALEAPETGVSLGQLERLLKRRFGHDEHIGGDLMQTESGALTLAVRGAGVRPKIFTGDPQSLDKLMTEAGEYVYRESEPALWTEYLVADGRYDDAIRFARGAYATVDPGERPYLLAVWADAIAGNGDSGALRDALSMYREAVRLKPDFWTAYGSIMFSLAALGEEEGTVQTGEQLMRAAGGRPGRAPEIVYQSYDAAIRDLPRVRAEQMADVQTRSRIGGDARGAGAENLQVAETDVQMHDIEAAAILLKTASFDEGHAHNAAQATIDRALLAEETGDLDAAARQWDQFVSEYASPAVSASFADHMCSAALTYEQTGQQAKADAAINAVGKLTFVDCERFRGDLLDLRGDWTGAQEWYAKAVQLAPSIPAGYYSWGVALAKHGQFESAAAKLKDAHQKGPHWADALKAWGDVLAKQGKIKDARARYNEALKYAPNWKQLKAAARAAQGA